MSSSATALSSSHRYIHHQHHNNYSHHHHLSLIRVGENNNDSLYKDRHDIIITINAKHIILLSSSATASSSWYHHHHQHIKTIVIIIILILPLIKDARGDNMIGRSLKWSLKYVRVVSHVLWIKNRESTILSKIEIPQFAFDHFTFEREAPCLFRLEMREKGGIISFWRKQRNQTNLGTAFCFYQETYIDMVIPRPKRF